MATRLMGRRGCGSIRTETKIPEFKIQAAEGMAVNWSPSMKHQTQNWDLTISAYFPLNEMNIGSQSKI